MEVVMGRAKELVVGREEEVLAEAGGRGRPGEAFPFQVTFARQSGSGRVGHARAFVHGLHLALFAPRGTGGAKFARLAFLQSSALFLVEDLP